MGALDPIEDVVADIVEERWSRGVLGVSEGDDRPDRLVVHVYQLQGVLRHIAALGHHDRHRVAHEPDPVGGQGR